MELAFGLAWLISGLAAYLGVLSYFKRRYPRAEVYRARWWIRSLAGLFAIMGPVGFITLVVVWAVAK